MRNKFLILTITAVSAVAIGCGGTATTNSNVNSTGARNSNTPDGITTSPMPPSTNTTPGIPNQPTNVPKGTTPTPGIPDPATIGKTPVPKGATPTPGIPSEAELKKMHKNPKNVNAASDPNAELQQRDGVNSPRNKRKVN